MLEDIEALINEHCQKHPQVSNDQVEASNILELEELSTLNQLADASDQLIPVQTTKEANAVVVALHSVP